MKRTSGNPSAEHAAARAAMGTRTAQRLGDVECPGRIRPRRLQNDLHCPMHPKCAGPSGRMPECGMASSPDAASTTKKPRARRLPSSLLVELAADRRRDALAMAGHRLTSSARRKAGSSSCSQRLVLWAGWPFFVRRSTRSEQESNMWTLIGLGTVAAFVYSVVGPSRRGLPGVVRGDGTVSVYFEAAAVIISLTLLVRSRAEGRSQTSPRSSPARPAPRRAPHPPTARKRTCRWATSTSAIAGAAQTGERCRLTVGGRRQQRGSTNRCSPRADAGRKERRRQAIGRR